jgi:hypothetical protein
MPGRSLSQSGDRYTLQQDEEQKSGY